jgi:2-amino-4-hydroxy-6-hydroxymethyldihydropteridine diphosphokinase
VAEALLALGGNVGDARATLDRAVSLLCDDATVRLVARSSDYRTPPWGPVEQDWFVNACVLVDTALAPEVLLALCQRIERELGRTREIRWGPRSIDIDILTYAGVTRATPALTLPHPLALERAFVLVPLAEIAPDLEIRGRRVADALAEIGTEGVVKLD